MARCPRVVVAGRRRPRSTSDKIISCTRSDAACTNTRGERGRPDSVHVSLTSRTRSETAVDSEGSAVPANSPDRADGTVASRVRPGVQVGQTRRHHATGLLDVITVASPLTRTRRDGGGTVERASDRAGHAAIRIGGPSVHAAEDGGFEKSPPDAGQAQRPPGVPRGLRTRRPAASCSVRGSSGTTVSNGAIALQSRPHVRRWCLRRTVRAHPDGGRAARGRRAPRPRRGEKSAGVAPVHRRRRTRRQIHPAASRRPTTDGRPRCRWLGRRRRRVDGIGDPTGTVHSCATVDDVAHPASEGRRVRMQASDEHFSAER